MIARIPSQRRTIEAALVSVNASLAKPQTGARSGTSAIDKRAVLGSVDVRTLGVAGDEQADRKHHGGVDKAVYAYANESTAAWEAALGRSLWPGAFGENLTTVGLDVDGAVIGETWAVGSVVLQVRQPRIPCRVLELFHDRPGLQREFVAAARPGAYLAVLQEGSLRAGDALRVLDRPAHGVTVAEVFRARMGERHLVPRMLHADGLPLAEREWAQRVLSPSVLSPIPSSPGPG